MKIELYNNTAEIVRVNKTNYLTSVLSLEGTLREECSIIEPSITVQSTGLITANYAYIPEFNRYYFIKEITSVKMGLWRIDMEVDVLMSFKDDILNIKGIIGRNEYSFRNDIIDKNFLFNKLPQLTYLEYDTPMSLNTNKYGLIVTFITNNISSNVLKDNQVFSPYNKCTKTILFYDINTITTFFNKVIADTALTSYILSVAAFPFDIDTIPNKVAVNKIILGKTEIAFTGEQGLSKYVYELTGKSDTKFIIDIKIDPAYNLQILNNTAFSWLNYKPYSIYDIYLPYYGWYSIDNAFVVPDEPYKYKTVSVEYFIDFSNSSCNINIYTENKEKPIAVLSCPIGSQFPITSDGLADSYRRTTANTINRISGELSGVATMAVGVATENPVLAVSGAMNIAKSGLTFEANETLNVPSATRNGNYSGYCSIFTYTKIVLRRTFFYTVFGENENYAHMFGRPYYEFSLLKEINGFTQMCEFHLENFPNTTSVELKKIEDILYEGFIL